MASYPKKHHFQSPCGLIIACLAMALLAGCGRREFFLSGTVTIASALQKHLPANNTVMFIVAKNDGDVPVAIHRIVNPQFPVRFSIEPEDLIVPELPTDTPLRIEIEMNSHGAAGRPIRGDLKGAHPSPVYPGEKRIHVVVDRQV